MRYLVCLLLILLIISGCSHNISDNTDKSDQELSPEEKFIEEISDTKDIDGAFEDLESIEE